MDMVPRSGAYALSFLLVCLAIACAPTRAKDSAKESAKCSLSEDEHATNGVASDSTVLSVEGFDARVKVPAQWQFSRQGSSIVASAHKHRAEYVVAGACTPQDAKQILARAAQDFGLTILGDIPEREVTVNGLHATRMDFTGALEKGKRAKGVALVADSPKGKGFIVILGYVKDGHEELSAELGAAIESLSAS